jgi:hypothetical protein
MKGRILQKLPDLFVTEKGQQVKTAGDWKERREELKKLAIGIGYGGMPPEPDSTEGELLAGDPGGFSVYKVTARSGGRELCFELRLFMPRVFPGDEGKKFPVILEGDGCWRNLTDVVIEGIT